MDRYASDTIYQKIESSYVTLLEEDRRMCNEHLDAVIKQTLLPLMKKDDLFNLMFRRIVFGGSYYKGTKYDKPDEYDLDFVMDLPIYDDGRIGIYTNHKRYGFAKLKLDSNNLTPDWSYHSNILDNWISSNNFLNSYNFRKWVRDVLHSVLDQYRKGENYSMRANGRTYTIKYRDSGPAFTLLIEYGKKVKISVDIVPCLEFEIKSLGNGYRPSNGRSRSVMFIPKHLDRCIPDRFFLWRLSFYQQEKELLDGRIKSTIKMMKKFRDSKNWDNLASYYIETIFYHALENNKKKINNFLNQSKATLFMWGLHELRKALRNKKLPYFWNNHHNLFDGLSIRDFNNYTNQLDGVINSIQSGISKDSSILAYHILKPYEFRDFKDNWFRKILQFFGYKSSRRTFGLDLIDHCWEFYDQYKYWAMIILILFCGLSINDQNNENVNSVEQSYS